MMETVMQTYHQDDGLHHSNLLEIEFVTEMIHKLLQSREIYFLLNRWLINFPRETTDKGLFSS